MSQSKGGKAATVKDKEGPKPNDWGTQGMIGPYDDIIDLPHPTSERQIEVRCADSNAFRWYLGIDLDERVPDHSTISQLRRRKPAFRKVFRRLFEEVVRQCVEKGLVSGRLAVTDSTHVKANASRASAMARSSDCCIPRLQCSKCRRARYRRTIRF